MEIKGFIVFDGAHRFADYVKQLSSTIQQDSASTADVPEGIDLNVFHSPQVASMLNSGGREDRRKAYEKAMREARQKREGGEIARSTSVDEFVSTSHSQSTQAGPLWGDGDVVRDESDRAYKPDQPEGAETRDTKDLADLLAAEARQQEVCCSSL